MSLLLPYFFIFVQLASYRSSVKAGFPERRLMGNVTADINRLDAFLKRRKRYCYWACCPENFPTVSELFSDADDQLFSRTSHIQTHVLKPLLPTNTQHSYNLRDRSHNYSLIDKDSHINDCHFIVRLLYKHAY